MARMVGMERSPIAQRLVDVARFSSAKARCPYSGDIHARSNHITIMPARSRGANGHRRCGVADFRVHRVDPSISGCFSALLSMTRFGSCVG